VQAAIALRVLFYGHQVPMIRFSCPTCQKTFIVSDELAGRSATCRRCDGKIVVPHPGAAATAEIAEQQPVTAQIVSDPADPQPDAASASTPEPSTPEPQARQNQPRKNQPRQNQPQKNQPRKKPPVRIRRLTADAEKIAAAFTDFPHISIHQTQGDPPDYYRIRYNIRGLARGANGRPVVREEHLAEIQLTLDYPRQSPRCRMLTPVFHPNIETAAICVGDHWTAGERLVDLIIRIGEMIAYQAYNIQSPLDGEAAMWADKNASQLPIDPRDLHPPGLE